MFHKFFTEFGNLCLNFHSPILSFMTLSVNQFSNQFLWCWKFSDKLDWKSFFGSVTCCFSRALRSTPALMALCLEISIKRSSLTWSIDFSKLFSISVKERGSKLISPIKFWIKDWRFSSIVRKLLFQSKTLDSTHGEWTTFSHDCLPLSFWQLQSSTSLWPAELKSLEAWC